ncbi:pseudaminic acid cytidylyltransferase [Algicella marina]|uniref:Pseudaminic acid cytidylyltransferase n=1 Tax=Algicella marina TaxID=2683284 RepID=A0A6P1SY93_9RHOB|nr:pseudaminic acid cytidylyltransferase [Algicella marina]QHQ34600.1 pseudaminic acid cytidylyltransferase [Algicella marina]
MNWAVIPARGGSKRVPRKNIRSFCGKPMIAWVIEALHKAGCFADIAVSTDSEEIADVARSYGVTVPFMRPDDLSDDMTGTTDVIAHAVAWARGQGREYDSVTCAYATAPFLRPEDVLKALSKLSEEGRDFVFPVTAFPAPIERAIRLNDRGDVSMDRPDHFATRSQDLAPVYHDAGQFYVGKPEAWLQKRKLFSEASGALVLPGWRVQDIDTEDDWHRAELMFRALGYDEN